jgi:hypothetical protein
MYIYIYVNELSDTKHMTVRIAASASKAHPGVQNHIGGKFPDAMDDVYGTMGIQWEYHGENDDVMFTWRFVT